jgi:uncharacterized protein (TIGR04255 family)
VEQGLYPKLERPPVVEVVCGVVYEPIAQVDPFLMGVYWKRRHPFFEQRLLQPPLLDPPNVVLGLGIGPVRSWLVSRDEVFVVQVQADRYYLNWRLRNGDYPRFNDPRPNAPGILSRFLEEFRLFSEFLIEEIGIAPKVQHLQLSKIDHFVEFQDWEGLSDLARILPWLRPFGNFSSSKQPEIAVNFSESSENSTVRVSMNMLSQADQARRVLRLDTQLIALRTEDSLADDFRACNRELNRVFFDLVADDELKRFRAKGAQ